MASNESGDNVLELLQQLEKLKQKKAHNVKKLKRKLGRAVIFTEDSNIEFISDSSQQKRSILSELNCKNSSLPTLQSSEKESLLRGIGNCTDHNEDACSNLQPSHSKAATSLQITQPLLHQSPSKSNENNISANFDIYPTTSANCFDVNADKNLQNQIHLKKRSSSELISEEEQFINHSLSSKKLKRSDGSASTSQIHTDCSVKTMIAKVDELYSEMSPINMCHSGQIPDHSSTDCQNKEDTCTENDTIGVVPSSQIGINSLSIRVQTSHSIKEQESKNLELSPEKIRDCQISSSVDKTNLVLKYPEDPNQVDVVRDIICDVKINKIESNEDQLKSPVENTEMINNAEKTETVLDIRNSSHNSASVNQNLNQENEPLELHFEEDLDFTITEIAETVTVFLSKSTPEIIGTDSNSLINTTHPEVANHEEIGVMNTLEADDVEDIMRDFKHSKNKFGEEYSEGLQMGLTDVDMQQDNSDSEREDTDTECDDSADGYEEDSEDDIIIKNSEDDTSNTSIVQELFEDGIIGQKENINMIAVENPQLDSINSDVLVVPETELFDFVRYNTSEMQVDDVAHNISVVTDSDSVVKDDHENIKKNVYDNQTGEKSVSFNLDENFVVYNKVESKHEEQLNLPSEHVDVTNVKKSNFFSNISEDQILNNQLYTETDFDTDSPGTEDFLKLVNYQQMLYTSENSRTDLQQDYVSHCKNSSLKFTCSLQCGITEPVCNLKLTSFNNNQYLFIQHLTWIQVWRHEENEEWVKIFCHQVEESFQLQELCVSNDENYLLLVILLISEGHDPCLQFVVFEKESKLIKLMGYTQQFESSWIDEERAFLCGLDNMRFASSAQGKETVKVCSHAINCLHDSPSLLTLSLGVISDRLHSLCKIDKLPNALLGLSCNMLYVWHLVDARLVTSVPLQCAASLIIENCIWATIENGLVFLLVSCEKKEGPEASMLLAANLATGFCQIALSYTLQPALETKSLNSGVSLAYSEPVIGAISKDGAFIWSVQEEYCCASLKETNISSITLAPVQDKCMIFLGCDGGCVNCYELKFL